eukprot:254858_1
MNMTTTDDDSIEIDAVYTWSSILFALCGGVALCFCVFITIMIVCRCMSQSYDPDDEANIVDGYEKAHLIDIPSSDETFSTCNKSEGLKHGRLTLSSTNTNRKSEITGTLTNIEITEIEE